MTLTTISSTEVRSVAKAIVEVVDNGYVPSWAPTKYQQALRDLCDGLVDRTSERKSRLDRADKVLSRVLDAADRATLLSTRVETFYGGAMFYRQHQPTLPVPKMHEHYEHKWVAQGGETVAEVAQKFGYHTPGPLCAATYDYSPYMRLQKGDTIYIPWQPKTLGVLIKGSKEARKIAIQHLKEAKSKMDADFRELGHILLALDCLAAVMGSLGGEAAALEKTSQVTGALSKPVSKSAILARFATPTQRFLADAEAGKQIMEVTGILNDLWENKPSAVSILLRHVTGPLSPSWWASLVQAFLKGGEVDAFLKGPEAVSHRQIEELALSTDRTCTTLLSQEINMESQLKSSIYTHKCLRCSSWDLRACYRSAA